MESKFGFPYLTAQIQCLCIINNYWLDVCITYWWQYIEFLNSHLLVKSSYWSHLFTYCFIELIQNTDKGLLMVTSLLVWEWHPHIYETNWTLTRLYTVLWVLDLRCQIHINQLWDEIFTINWEAVLRWRPAITFWWIKCTFCNKMLFFSNEKFFMELWFPL